MTDAVSFGYAIWTAVRPWRRLKVWRNKRREAKGLPLLPLTEDDMNVFPKGTMRKSGAMLIGASPFIGMGAGFVVRLLGFGDECPPEAVEAGCVTAAAAADTITNLVTGAIGLVGGFTYWRGFNRAQKAEDK